MRNELKRKLKFKVREKEKQDKIASQNTSANKIEESNN